MPSICAVLEIEMAQEAQMKILEEESGIFQSHCIASHDRLVQIANCLHDEVLFYWMEWQG